MNTYLLSKSTNKGKKYMVYPIEGKWVVHFGASDYEDYTDHKDDKRKVNYLKRHKGMNQDWSKQGIKSAGFWSRWLLWNKKTIDKSIRDIENTFNINIILI